MSICTSYGPDQLEIKVFSDDDKCEQDLDLMKMFKWSVIPRGQFSTDRALSD